MFNSSLPAKIACSLLYTCRHNEDKEKQRISMKLSGQLSIKNDEESIHACVVVGGRGEERKREGRGVVVVGGRGKEKERERRGEES